MQKDKGLGSAKRFGARYGRRVKHRLAKIEREQRKKHKCPYCHAERVKRISVGIWLCTKCDAKFTGKAYSLEKKITRVEGSHVEEAPVEEEEE